MKLHERTGRRILSVPLIRDKTERSEKLQELNLNRNKKLNRFVTRLFRIMSIKNPAVEAQFPLGTPEIALWRG